MFIFACAEFDRVAVGVTPSSVLEIISTCFTNDRLLSVDSNFDFDLSFGLWGARAATLLASQRPNRVRHKCALRQFCDHIISIECIWRAMPARVAHSSHDRDDLCVGAE